MADTRGVPFFVKGFVRGKFPKERDRPVLLDWEGRFAKAYDWRPEETNVLVFDEHGTLVHQTHGTEVVAERVDEVCDKLRDLLQDE